MAERMHAPEQQSEGNKGNLREGSLLAWGTKSVNAAALVGRSSDSQPLQVFHEHLQRHIVREDGSATTTAATVHSTAHMRCRRVKLRQQESSLRTVLIANNVTRDGEAVCQQVLSIGLWIFQYLFEVFISFLILIPRFSPLSHRLTVEYEDVEESIQQQDHIRSDGDRVKQDGLRCAFESVRHERGLNHDQRVVDVFRVENMAVESGLIR